jgi:hypothetical protein
MKRAFVIGATVATLIASAPSTAVADHPSTAPPGCQVWLSDDRKIAYGACDSSVITPWRLAATFCVSVHCYRPHTEYSLVSPKFMESWTIWYNPAIELQP